MRIKLHTGGKRYFSETEWEQIHKAFSFFSDKFNISKYGNIPVYVIFSKKIKGSFDGATTQGLCLIRYNQHRTLSFTIEIVIRSSMHAIFDTIFHEMVHVMQNLRGDFRRLLGGDYYYKNNYYSASKLASAGHDEYMNFPWEIEAREVSKELLKEWYTLVNNKRSKWQKVKDLLGLNGRRTAYNFPQKASKNSYEAIWIA